MTPEESFLPTGLTETRTYTNPLHPGYFADPFVWKAHGTYYAIGTGPLEAGGELDDAERAAPSFGPEMRIFPMLRSDDFVHWQPIKHALLPPDAALGGEFWAPEVACHGSHYYLYYSVGGAGKGHQLRAAKSEHPMGPYRDTGNALVNPRVFPFVIDAHPFQDDDGQWYLFYARDFLDTDNNARAGTALMVDRLTDMTTLAGEARTVLRSRFDWQRWESDRPMYGETWDWHTIEGPCVRKHEGRYYCFYSGGRWETETYGVDYAVADSVMGPYSDEGSENGARVLRTIPGHVTGPGHCSIVTGPDGATDYVVYHAWDSAMTARRICMDALVWTPDGPRCTPTWEPQTVTARVDPQARL